MSQCNAEEIQKLFDQLLQPWTNFDMKLRPSEMSYLLKCDEAELLHSARSTARWLQKKQALGHTPSHNGVYHSVVESVAYNRSKRAGTLPTPTLITVPEAPVFVPIVTEEDRADKVRGLFQTFVSDGTWTITTQEAEQLLLEHSMKALKYVFNTLGRAYAEEEVQTALDAIAWHAELSTLVNQ
jgi:hypothetical protein